MGSITGCHEKGYAYLSKLEHRRRERAARVCPTFPSLISPPKYSRPKLIVGNVGDMLTKLSG